MIQKWLTKYGLVFHVACICLFPLCCLNQSRVFGLVPLLWLSLMAAEVMFLLPSVRRTETLADARQRVWRALAWDPFFYLGVVFVGMVVVQWLNSGCELVYLSDADVWQVSDPPVSWAPFSVEARAALTQVAVFAACVTVGVCLRAALSRASKRLLLQTLACVSGGLAVYAVAQACQKAQPYLLQTSGLEAPAMGAFFGFWLLVGMGILAEALSRGQRGCVLLFLLGLVGNLLGMLFFASALALTVYTVLACLQFVYVLVYLSSCLSKSAQFKLFLVSMLAVGAMVAWLVYLYPQNPVGAKLKAALPAAEYWNALSVTRQIRAEAALAIWQEHPWVGVGADGFQHFVGLAVDTQKWGLIKNDQAYVLNDWLQFLCEYGVFGIGLLLAAVASLIVPVCYRARNIWKYRTKFENADRAFVFRLSPIVVTGAVATAACAFESCLASPFRSAGLMLAWTCVMSAMPGFMPVLTRSDTQG